MTTNPAAWRCICGATGTGETSAATHATTCHDFGRPWANPAYPKPEGEDAPGWTVGAVAHAVEGDVVLRMTEEQATKLRETLVWLTGEEDA